MKVLWFEISTPSRYLHTGQVTLGWQDALENIVATCKDIELYIAFESQVLQKLRLLTVLLIFRCLPIILFGRIR